MPQRRESQRRDVLEQVADGAGQECVDQVVRVLRDGDHDARVRTFARDLRVDPTKVLPGPSAISLHATPRPGLNNPA